MNKDSFDKALKNKLPNTAADFDMEAAWTALEARRQQPKRRAIGWWFLLFAVLLAGFATWWRTSNTAPAIAPTAQHEVVADVKKTAQSATHSPTQSTVPGADAAIKNTGLEKRQVPGELDENLPAETAKNSGIKSPTGLNKQPKQPSALPPSSIKPETTAPANVKILTDKPVTAPSSATKTAATKLPLPISEIQVPERPVQFPTVFFDFVKKNRRPKKANWSIGASAVYGLNKVVRSGSDVDLDQRKQEEKTLDQIQIGLDIRRRFTRQWFIQSGIQYSQWTDVQQIFEEDISIVSDSNLLLQKIHYSNGSIENVYGPGDLKVIHTVAGKRYNRYRHIEVPFMLGAALAVGKHWQLDISAGAAFGLFASQSGMAPAGSALVPLSTLPYRRAGTISALGSLSWMYRATHWSAGISLVGRSGLNSSTETAAAFIEKRQALGLGIVLRRDIFSIGR